ncbi:MAG: MBL fold metallo-hydrolase [Sphingobacteriales bacterium]|nr:MAG: MBL fold metallo-hydrolase [Sphingobacteriales bacterium]
MVMREQLDKKEAHSLYFEVAPNVWGTKDIFVNMYMVRNPEDSTWVLIDAGLKSSYAKIKKMAAELFGPNSKPEAILLTHGHFDHIGSLHRLVEEWGVEVYAHYLELPYLSGKSSYPPPDPSVGGGLMASASWMYPKTPINIESHLNVLPPDGTVPFLPGWIYLHTPGHAPGHVSFFRQRDKVLVAGDAVVTTNQESAMSVMMQTKILSGPPKYFTYDWEAAGSSVRNISDLRPAVIASGHGKPMSGRQMDTQLTNLSVHFRDLAVPNQGRYVNDPAVADANGVRYIPPAEKTNRTVLFAGLAIAAIAISLIVVGLSKSNKPDSLA